MDGIWIKVLLAAFLFGGASESFAARPSMKWLKSELKSEKLPIKFIEEVTARYETKSFEKVLNLNILGFLAPPQHSTLVSDDAVRASYNFIQKNKKLFKLAHEKYNVSPEIISSLLWIETRHGNLLGKFHVPSVYAHLLQLRRKSNQDKLYQRAQERNTEKKYSDEQLKTLISERAKRKSDWAVEQLKALAIIHDKRAKNLKSLRGSFAGAFGLPQFIPSSYHAWAVSTKKESMPNLFETSDSILSVASYLKGNGWDSEQINSHLEALMRYNHSRDYAESILEISKRVKDYAISRELPTRGLAVDKEQTD